MRFIRGVWAFLSSLLKLFRDLALIVLLAGTGYYFAIIIYGDNAINPDIVTFWATDEESYKTDNALIAAIGLSAPAKMRLKGNYDWALQFVQQDVESCKAALPVFENKDSYKNWDNLKDWKKFTNSTPCGGSVAGALSSGEALQFSGSTAGLECWMLRRYPGWAVAGLRDAKDCMTDAGAYELVRTNTTMLERYFSLSRYAHFISPPYVDGGDANITMLHAHSAFLADLVLLSYGSTPEVAISEWATNYAFLQKALSDKNTVLDHAILALMYNMSQRALPAILHDNIAAIKANQKLLQGVLQPFGSSNMNAERMEQAEYQNVSAVIGNLDNTSKNIFYRFQQITAALFQKTPDEMNEAKIYYHSRYSFDDSDKLAVAQNAFKTDWRYPLYGAVVNLTMNEEAADGADKLAEKMHLADASGRLLNLYVQIRALQLPPEKIQPFLDANTVLVDPYTGKPFKYDAASKSIYFSHIFGDKPETIAIWIP